MPLIIPQTKYYDYYEEIKKFNLTNEAKSNKLLDQYLLYVANSGNILFPWAFIKNLIYSKTQDSIDIMHQHDITNNFKSDDFPALNICVLELLQKFEECPFTIQRITELITNPFENYKNVMKYLRGLEKNLLVVSSIPENLIIEEFKDIGSNQNMIGYNHDCNMLQVTNEIGSNETDDYLKSDSLTFNNGENMTGVNKKFKVDV